MGELLPSRRLAQVLLAAGVATLVIVPPFWSERFGIPGALTAAALFGVVFVIVLKWQKVDEAGWLLQMVGSRLGVAPRTT